MALSLRQMDPATMQKLMEALGLAPGGMMPGAGGAPGGMAMKMPQPMDEQGRMVDPEGFPAYDEDVPNLPPSLRAAGERRKRFSGGDAPAPKKKAPKK